MSVFATHVQAMSLPPRYSNTRPQPPPYKPVSKPLIISTAPSIPPPIYKSTSNTSSTALSSSPSPSISTTSSLSEPPQYSSIVKNTQPKLRPQPTATPTTSRPTWKDPYVETDADDSLYEFQRNNERRRAREEEQKREEGEDNGNWCWGCFWVGPSVQQPYVSSYLL